MPVVFVQLVLIALIGYLWGSIPSGYWMGKLLRGRYFDIREYGSHKTGATNVLRTLGGGPAAIVFLLDLSKGLLPPLLALLLPFFFINGWGPVVAGIAALLGHCFPIFIGFKGGRGVMTGTGVMLLLSPLTTLVSAITACGTILIWRYVSLGSIVGAATAMICGLLWYVIGLMDPHFFAAIGLPTLTYFLVAPGLIIFFHHDNIKRLLSGTERKIGQTEKVESQASSARA